MDKFGLKKKRQIFSFEKLVKITLFDNDFWAENLTGQFPKKYTVMLIFANKFNREGK